jgi:hypothetical protein
VLTDFLVDLVYPVEPDAGAEPVAAVNRQVIGVHRAAAKGGSATFLGFRPRDDQAASLGEEVRTWFEILLALGAYPKTRAEASANDNPSAVSRTTPYLACAFPNGTTAVAVHYRTHEESWPGGFHRDAEKDKEAIARNPLPPDKLELRDFAVNGHRVTYDGSLAVAFRLDDRGALLAFAGHNCAKIVLDGREHAFASQPMALIAWAPVLAERRVAGGAVSELWVQGEAEVSMPLPAGVSKGGLFFHGSRPGAIGQPVTCSCEGGLLRFKAERGWGQRHLLFIAA